jgi:hypothetical protein
MQKIFTPRTNFLFGIIILIITAFMFHKKIMPYYSDSQSNLGVVIIGSLISFYPFIIACLLIAEGLINWNYKENVTT